MLWNHLFDKINQSNNSSTDPSSRPSKRPSVPNHILTLIFCDICLPYMESLGHHLLASVLDEKCGSSESFDQRALLLWKDARNSTEKMIRCVDGEKILRRNILLRITNQSPTSESSFAGNLLVKCVGVNNDESGEQSNLENGGAIKSDISVLLQAVSTLCKDHAMLDYVHGFPFVSDLKRNSFSVIESHGKILLFMIKICDAMDGWSKFGQDGTDTRHGALLTLATICLSLSWGKNQTQALSRIVKFCRLLFEKNQKKDQQPVEQEVEQQKTKEKENKEERETIDNISKEIILITADLLTASSRSHCDSSIWTESYVERSTLIVSLESITSSNCFTSTSTKLMKKMSSFDLPSVLKQRIQQWCFEAFADLHGTRPRHLNVDIAGLISNEKALQLAAAPFLDVFQECSCLPRMLNDLNNWKKFMTTKTFSFDTTRAEHFDIIKLEGATLNDVVCNMSDSSFLQIAVATNQSILDVNIESSLRVQERINGNHTISGSSNNIEMMPAAGRSSDENKYETTMGGGTSTTWSNMGSSSNNSSNNSSSSNSSCVFGAVSKI